MPWCRFQTSRSDGSVRQLVPVVPKPGDMVWVNRARAVVTTVKPVPPRDQDEIGHAALVLCEHEAA